MNGWTPNPNDLRQILELLHSSQTADNEVQKQVQEKLQQLNQYPDFHYYLAIILSASLPEFGQQDTDLQKIGYFYRFSGKVLMKIGRLSPISRASGSISKALKPKSKHQSRYRDPKTPSKLRCRSNKQKSIPKIEYPWFRMKLLDQWLV